MKNLTIKTTGWEMTNEIETYLAEKIQSIEKLLVDPDADTVRCDVELGQAREEHANKWRAEMSLFIGGESYRSVAVADGMEAALDEMKDEIQRQLRKGKRKQMSLVKRGGAMMKEWLRFGK